MSKRVIELIRVSTEGQAADDRAGIPAQRAANLRTVERYGLEVVRKIEMVDVSGSRVLSAPEMKELFASMESPEIHGVVAKEFSRVMRPEDLNDFAILQRFIETQTVLYLPDGPVDFSNKSGRLFGGIRALMAGFEKSEILERMNDAKEVMRRQGKNTGGSATLPYGVDYRDGQWSYTADAAKVREAFDQVLNTAKSYAQIARELNIERTNLRFILGNPIYIGWRVYSQKRDPRAIGYVPGSNGRQGYRRKINRSLDETIRVHVMDGLISEDVFHRVQQVLATRAAREREIRSKSAPEYLFNGFLVCGECGQPMYSHANQTAGYYFCKMNGTRARKKNPDAACPSPYMMARKLKPKIETLLCDRLQDERFLALVAKSYLDGQLSDANLTLDMQTITKQLEILRAKRERILDAYFDGAISRQDRNQRIAKVDGEILTFRKMAWSVGAGPPEDRRLTVADLVSVVSVFTEFPFLQPEEKRSMLRNFGVKIAVSAYTIRTLTVRKAARAGNCTDNHSKPSVFVTTAPMEICLPINW